MKRPIINVCVLFFMTLMVLVSCKEEIDTSARYVFKERTIADYLEDHEQFSEFVRLLGEQPVSDMSETNVFQLMTAYGNYTCFAPTNAAIQLYLDSLTLKGIINAPSWDAFPSEKIKDSIRSVIVMNSILDGYKAQKVFYVGDFPSGENEEFEVPTMGDCKITVNYDKVNVDKILIDKVCPVSTTNRDITCLNGIIHELAYPINPSNETLGGTLHIFANDPKSGYMVMGKLIEACGLTDTLSVTKDSQWEKKIKTGIITKSHWNNLNTDVNPPEHRKLGFTIFAETDDFWEKTLNKAVEDITVDDVIAWVDAKGFYPDAINDGNYKDEKNLLNQFVTYHILPMRIPVDKLVLHYNEKGFSRNGNLLRLTIPAWAHYVTMGKRRLIRLWESKESNGVYLNRFPVLNNERDGDYHEKYCEPENEGLFLNTSGESKLVKLVNAYIYPIDDVLVYDSHTRMNLKRQRLRYDTYDLMPEALTNDMRVMNYFDRFYFPADEVHQYFADFNVNTKDMTFYLLNGINQGWPNYQADEVLCEGTYDVTLRLPPVPISGIYEIRMGVSTESPWRGICQVYFGDKKDALYPAGIPVNMGLGGNSVNNPLGWELDTKDDPDYNAEVDKRMRNNGFMKGPEYFTETPGSSKDTGRSLEKTTRRILVRTNMDADKTYYLRFKTVQDNPNKQLFLDYLEWCPKEIFDNPDTPEDIW